MPAIHLHQTQPTTHALKQSVRIALPFVGEPKLEYELKDWKMDYMTGDSYTVIQIYEENNCDESDVAYKYDCVSELD